MTKTNKVVSSSFDDVGQLVATKDKKEKVHKNKNKNERKKKKKKRARYGDIRKKDLSKFFY